MIRDTSVIIIPKPDKMWHYLQVLVPGLVPKEYKKWEGVKGRGRWCESLIGPPELAYITKSVIFLIPAVINHPYHIIRG